MLSAHEVVIERRDRRVFSGLFLLVVAVGGAGTIRGPLAAALILGVFDVAGKYYVPQVGSFVIYAVMVVMLLLFPAGLAGRRA